MKVRNSPSTFSPRHHIRKAPTCQWWLGVTRPVVISSLFYFLDEIWSLRWRSEKDDIPIFEPSMIHGFCVPRSQDNGLSLMWESLCLPCLSSWQRWVQVRHCVINPCCLTLLSRMSQNHVAAELTRFSPLLSQQKTQAGRRRPAGPCWSNTTWPTFLKGKMGKGKFICIAQFNARQFKVLYINIKSNKIQHNKTKWKRTKKIATIMKKKIKDTNSFFLCGIMHVLCDSGNFAPRLYKPEGYHRSCNLQS